MYLKGLDVEIDLRKAYDHFKLAATYYIITELQKTPSTIKIP